MDDEKGGTIGRGSDGKGQWEGYVKGNVIVPHQHSVEVEVL